MEELSSEPRDTTITTDEAIRRVGGHHTFQIIALIIIAISFSSGGQIAYALPYNYSKKINLQCVNNFGETVLCTPEVACDGSQTRSYSYIHDSHRTLVNWLVDFEIACWSKESLSWFGTIFFGGFLLGSLVFLSLADKIGRRPLVLCGLVVHLILNITLNYVRSKGYLFAYLVLFGLRVPMANQVAALLLIEFISPEKRGYFSIMTASLDGLFNTFIALGYKYWQDWKRWYLFNDIQVFVVLIAFAIFVTQSARYYISRNQYAKARNVFKRIATINRRKMFTEALQGEYRSSLEFEPSRAGSATSAQSSPSSLSSARRNRFVRLCKRSLYDRILIATVMFLWFSVDIVFYGIGFGINELSGDLYTNGIILGISDLVSLIVAAVLVNVIGRKKSILLTWFLAATGSIVYYFVSDYQYAAYAAVLVARFGGSGTFQILYLYTSEAFPSQVRGTILGISNAMARVGGLIAPLLSSYIDHFMLVLGVLGAASFFISFVLRETFGQKMEDKIDREEGEDLKLVEESNTPGYQQLG